MADLNRRPSQNCDLSTKFVYRGLLRERARKTLSTQNLRGYMLTSDDEDGCNNFKLSEDEKKELSLVITRKIENKLSLNRVAMTAKLRRSRIEAQSLNKSRSEVAEPHNGIQNEIPISSCYCFPNLKENTASIDEVQLQSTKCDKVYAKKRERKEHSLQCRKSIMQDIIKHHDRIEGGFSMHTNEVEKDTREKNFSKTELHENFEDKQLMSTDKIFKEEKSPSIDGNVLSYNPNASSTSNKSKLNSIKSRKNDERLKKLEQVLKLKQSSCKYSNTPHTKATKTTNKDNLNEFKNPLRSSRCKTSDPTTLSAKSSRITKDNSFISTGIKFNVPETSSPQPNKKQTQSLSRANNNLENHLDDSERGQKPNECKKQSISKQSSKHCSKKLSGTVLSQVENFQEEPKQSLQQFHCCKCSSSFTKVSHLEKHMLQFHRDKSLENTARNKDIEKDTRTPKLQKSPDCFNQESGIFDRKTTKPKLYSPVTESYICMQCDCIFGEFKSFQKHILQAHLQEPHESLIDKNHNVQSELASKQKDQPTTSMATNNPDERLKNVTAISKSQPDLNTYRELKAFPCDVCNRSFNTSARLVRHIEDVHIAEIKNPTLRKGCKKLAIERGHQEKAMNKLKNVTTQTLKSTRK